jgi:hypothetical protein
MIWPKIMLNDSSIGVWDQCFMIVSEDHLRIGAGRME